MITTNETDHGTTISIDGNVAIIPTNPDVNALVQEYQNSPSDENMAKVIAKIDDIQSVNRFELIANDNVKYYPNKDKYYFSDDNLEEFELTETTVLELEMIVDKGGNIAPIVNFLKLLRRNKNYTPSFAEECLSVITSTITNKKIYNTLVDKGFYREVAYMQANVNLFTLTEDGYVVAYKKADFKRHKFDTKTGERIDRFPFSFDEETGEKLFVYPETAEEFKIYLDSKTIDNLETRGEENKYIKVGSIIDQRKGKPGFEKDEISLIFKGTKVSDENKLYVQVLIHPMYINKVSDKFDSISTAVYYVTKFSFRNSIAEVNHSVLTKYANADWKSIVDEMKKQAEKDAKAKTDKIAFKENL